MRVSPESKQESVGYHPELRHEHSEAPARTEHIAEKHRPEEHVIVENSEVDFHEWQCEDAELTVQIPHSKHKESNHADEAQ